MKIAKNSGKNYKIMEIHSNSQNSSHYLQSKRQLRFFILD